MTLRLHRAAVTLPQHLLPFDSKSATKLAKSPSSLSQQGMLKQDVLRREQQKRLPNRALSRIAWQSSFPSSSIANVQKRRRTRAHRMLLFGQCITEASLCADEFEKTRNLPLEANPWQTFTQGNTDRTRAASHRAPVHQARAASRRAPLHRTRAASHRAPVHQARAASHRAPLHRTRAAFRRAQNAARLSEAPYPTALSASSEPRQTKRRPREALLL